MAVPDSEIL